MTPTGRARRPSPFQGRQFARQLGGEIGGDGVGAPRRRLVERSPAVDRQIVGAAHREVAAGDVHARQRLAQRLAVGGRRPPRPHPAQEGDDRRAAAGEAAQRATVATLDRRRTGNAAGREMLHQPQEERQIVLLHPPFVERQNERPLLGDQQEVRVFDAFGDALAGDDPADVVLLGEGLNLLVGDFGVDGHGGILSRVPARR